MPTHLTEDEHNPHFFKYEVFRRAYQCLNAAPDVFDGQMLFLDADIYVRSGAPDIFEQYPTGGWLRPESPHPRPHAITIAKNWIRKNCDRRFIGEYYNTGVILGSYIWWRGLVGGLKKIVPKKGPYFEQDQLNAVIYRYADAVDYLPIQFNAPIGPNWHDLVGDYNEVAFLHGNGMPFKDKYDTLASFIEKYP